MNKGEEIDFTGIECEGGRDGLGFSHGDGAAAGACACPAPASEDRFSSGCGGKGDHRVVYEAGRASGAAVDARRGAGHGAGAGASLADRQGVGGLGIGL